LLLDIINRTKENGMQFDVVYDIGACTGNFSRWMKNSVLP